MKPTFKLFVGIRHILVFGIIFIGTHVWAQVAATPDAGGDTLDTSTPAPAGIEAAPTPATAPANQVDNESDDFSVEPEIGGFLVPIEGDVFYEPDVRVLVSLPGAPPASMVLLLDGLPVSSPLAIKEELLTVTIQIHKSGAHQLSLLLFNEHTEITAKLETRFFVRLPEPQRAIRNSNFKQFGRVVAKVDWKNGEAKGRILSQSELSLKPDTRDTLVAGKAEAPVSQELDGATEAAYNIKYKQVQAFGKVLLRTDENRFRQPAHRITTSLKYGPWAALKAGDIYPLYNSLVLNGTRVRGAEAMMNIVTSEKKWASLRVVRGESRREVPAYLVKYDTGNGTRTDTVTGTYGQTLSAARLGLGGGPAFELGFSLLKASDHEGSADREQVNSMLHGLRPADNLVPGMDLRIGIWDGRIQIFGNSAMSLYTRDRSLGAFHPDTFAVAINPENFKNVFIFNATTRGWQYLLSKKATNTSPDVLGFMGTNSAYEGGVVSSLPFAGVVAETELRYSHLGLDYHSEGNPFLGGNPGDGFTLLQKLIVLENKLSLGLELGNYAQDLGITKTIQRNVKAEIRFTPGPYQPSLWIGGGYSNIVPDGSFVHQFRSSFLNFNSGGYHQFQVADGKMYTTLLYGFTQSKYSLETQDPTDTSQNFPTTRTNIVNAMLQYKMHNTEFLPRLAYTFSHNGIQLPTNAISMGFLQPFLENTVRLDLSSTIGQYPESNKKNDLSLGAAAAVEYVLGPQQTFRIRERWIQYGKRRSLLLGANYEMFF